MILQSDVKIDITAIILSAARAVVIRRCSKFEGAIWQKAYVLGFFVSHLTSDIFWQGRCFHDTTDFCCRLTLLSSSNSGWAFEESPPLTSKVSFQPTFSVAKFLNHMTAQRMPKIAQLAIKFPIQHPVHCHYPYWQQRKSMDRSLQQTATHVRTMRRPIES